MIPSAELRDYVQATAADEPILAQMELGAVAFMQTQTGHYFGPPGEVTESISGAGAQALYLRESAVATPAPVVELWDGSAWSTVAAGDYRVAGNVLLHTTTWTAGTWNYRVTYTRGYDEEDVPADIRDRVLELVAAKWKARGSEGMKSETIGGYSYTRADVTDMESFNRTVEAWRGWPFA